MTEDQTQPTPDVTPEPAPAPEPSPAPETPAAGAAPPAPIDRVRKRLGLEPSPAPAPATAKPVAPATLSASDYEKAQAAYRQRQRERSYRQRNEELLRRIEQRLAPTPTPAAPAEVPNPDLEPTRWLEHALDQRLKPIVDAFSTVKEQQQAHEREAQEIQQFQAWQEAKKAELNELTEEYIATPTGAAHRERLQQWAYLRHVQLVHAGQSEAAAAQLVHASLQGMIAQAEQQGLNPVVFADRWISTELRSWGYTEAEIAAGGKTGSKAGASRPAPPANPEIAQLQAAAKSPLAGGPGTPRGPAGRGSEVEKFVNAGGDVAAMKAVVGTGPDWKNKLRRLQREARARA